LVSVHLLLHFLHMVREGGWPFSHFEKHVVVWVLFGAISGEVSQGLVDWLVRHEFGYFCINLGFHVD
jgi:hypothetical protein